MKITQGFDVNQDGKNDIYITRDMPDAKTGCWMMLVVAAAFVVAAVLFSDGCRNFRAIYIENIRRAQAENAKPKPYVPPREPSVVEKVVGLISTVLVFSTLVCVLVQNRDRVRYALVHPRVMFPSFLWLLSGPEKPPERELTISDVSRLSKATGSICVDGVTSLSIDAAKWLSEQQCGLDLSAITQMSDEVAEALAGTKGFLRLNGLASLSKNAAQSLAKHDGFLSLNGVSSLSMDAAVGIAKRQQVTMLRGLVDVFGPVATVLRSNPNIQLRGSGGRGPHHRRGST